MSESVLEQGERKAKAASNSIWEELQKVTAEVYEQQMQQMFSKLEEEHHLHTEEL